MEKVTVVTDRSEGAGGRDGWGEEGDGLLPVQPLASIQSMMSEYFEDSVLSLSALTNSLCYAFRYTALA